MSTDTVDKRLSAEHRFKLYYLVIRSVSEVVKWLAGAGVVAICVLSISKCAQVFAGRDTSADLTVGVATDGNIVLELVSTIGTVPVFFVIVGILAILYGWLERRLRYKKTAHLQGRIRDLELSIDPERTTSGLTETGETP